MATTNNRPEGTDTIIDDGTTDAVENEGNATNRGGQGAAAVGGGAAAGSGSASSGGSASGGGGAAEGLFAAFRQAAANGTAGLRDQAGEHARNYANQGKERASDALGNLAKLVSDAAATVEEKVGPEYAGYARRAAEAVNGAADGLRNKNVDELLEDAKGYVRSSPALAIGLAAALGFVVARVARAGTGETGEGTTGQDS